MEKMMRWQWRPPVSPLKIKNKNIFMAPLGLKYFSTNLNT
jgi:hypothetical protein